MNSSVASKLNNFMRWFFIIALFCCFMPTNVAWGDYAQCQCFYSGASIAPPGNICDCGLNNDCKITYYDNSGTKTSTETGKWFKAIEKCIECTSHNEGYLLADKDTIYIKPEWSYFKTVCGADAYCEDKVTGADCGDESVRKNYKCNIDGKCVLPPDNYQIKELMIDPNPVVGGQKVSCTAKLTNNGTPVEGETIKFTIQEGRDPQQEETCPSNRNGECTIEYTTSSTTENKDLFVEASYEGKASEMKVITITPVSMSIESEHEPGPESSESTPDPEPKPSLSYTNVLSRINNLFQGGEVLIKAVLGLIGTVALLLLVIAGAMYITAAGSEEKVRDAKKIITGTIIGLSIALLAFSFLTTIATILGVK